MRPLTKALLLSVLALLSFSALAERTITYYHTDLTGSPVAATDAVGAVIWRKQYAPYGEASGNDGQNRRGFTGHVEDSNGLVYAGARYYDPGMGRFLSVDPVGFVESNPHSFNRYAYANNNPYKFVDPDGRIPVPLIIIGALKFADMAATGYGVYTAAQTGGASAVALELGQSAAASIVPGGKSLKTAAKALPPMKGMGARERARALSEGGFEQTKVSNSAARNETWDHADGSEVRVHPYGNQNASPYKSGNNGHLHKQDPSGNQLNDRGQISADPSATHIGLPNPTNFPSIRGRPNGS